VARILVAKQDADGREQHQEPDSDEDHSGYLRCVIAAEPGPTGSRRWIAADRRSFDVYGGIVPNKSHASKRLA
jgi:hypothetical protein